MAKRVQEQKDEEKLWKKSRLTAMKLSSSVPASSSSAKNLITSSDHGKLMAAGKPASRTRRISRPDEAPSSQVKLKDVYLHGLMDGSAGKLVATEEIRYYGIFLNLNLEAFMRMKWQVSLCFTKKARRNLRLPSFQKNQGILKLKEGNGHMISTYPLQSCLAWTKSIRLWERLTTEDPRTKWRTLTWTHLFGWMFMNTALQATVHLVQDYDQNIRFAKNHFWSSFKKLFTESEK